MRELTVPARREVLESVTDEANLTDAIFRNVAEAGDEVGMRRRTADGWVSVTWNQFAAEVRALAKGLIAKGVAPGDRVTLMSKTRYEWTLADYAIWCAGAVTVPIYETSSSEQVAWILSDSGAVAMIAESELHTLDRHRRARSGSPAARHLADRRWRPRHPRRRGRRRTGLRGRGPSHGAARRHPGDDHLHQRHHRASQGLRADPWQLRLRRGVDHQRPGPAL